MNKKKISRIYASDSNYVPVHVYIKQDNKYYEYIPRIGDSFQLNFFDSETKDLKHTQTATVAEEVADTYLIKLDHLEKGLYTCDVRLSTVDGDTYLIVNDKQLEVEEDE